MKRLFSLFSVSLLLSLFLALSPMGSAQSMKPGTEIRVQLLDQLDTGKVQAGEEFAATLAEPVVSDSGAVWPKGTQVKGKVVDVVSSGRLSKPASITLRLTQIGNAPLETENETIDGKSHAGRNAALIGGMGALGAVIGGIAGGGKGAAIGVAAGAGAGVATAAATGKQEIVLRPETPLIFAVAGNVATEPQASSPVPEPVEAAQPQDQPQDSGSYEPYAPDQLDNLLAPIALYPDPLLAQVLLAATFPDEVQDAAQWVRRNDPNSIDYQGWDVSVKAVAHYPTVLAMLNERLDWTTAVGQAYVYQSSDVMTSVQRLRNLAYSQGNLVTTPQQQLLVEGGYIQIVPAQPRVIYVPAYDPGVIYVRPVYRPGFGFNGFFSFGTGFVIGAWLNHDLDWNSHRVVYDGWDEGRGGWRERSRPYIQVTNVYVNNRYEQVNVNRDVVVRQVNYENVNRYNSVHRDVTFDNRARIEPNRVQNEQMRAGQPDSHGPNDRINERGNGRGNQFGVRNQPSDRQPQQPQTPSNASFERANQSPSSVAPSTPQSSNDRINERGNGRGNQFGVRNQPSDRQPQQPQTPSNASFGRVNQSPSNVAPSTPQSPSDRTNERGNGRGNQFGVRNQPSSDRQSQQPQTPSNASFGRANQSPSNVAPSTPQSSNDRVNERGNGRGNQFGLRNQSSPTEQPARTSSPQPAPQAPQAASGGLSGARPSTENHAGSQPRQAEHQASPAPGNKGKENAKGSGGEKKK